MPKPLCPHGLACPHQHHHQHTSEFSHVDMSEVERASRVERAWRTEGKATGTKDGARPGGKRGRGGSRLLDGIEEGMRRAKERRKNEVIELLDSDDEEGGGVDDGKGRLPSNVVELLDSDDGEGEEKKNGVKSDRRRRGRQPQQDASPELVAWSVPSSSSSSSLGRAVAVAPGPARLPFSGALHGLLPPGLLPPPPVSREEREMNAALSASNAALKNDQDLEYRRSLEEDREKERRAREEEVRREEEKVVEEVKRVSEMEGRAEEGRRREREREEISRQMPKDSGPGTVSVLIKLPRGWPSGSVSLPCHSESPASLLARYVMAMEERPAACEGVDVYTTFPVRRVEGDEKVGGIGLGKRGTLVVREIEVEDG
eukprot:CAMPEP_0182454730 /NCGR_PEP_ID=MMETSP1319-20130603/1231_1 /TAXON_ID=172717 /ORGANISM="Bolidomonas pacifica, Strain RCC208" /LENGTH=371 /DNA_ID=CAMNT_0024652751 /DNA_START=203 /DNA_END=1315 /DNA_ORIENTATION=+